jgi:hypothetical protein
MDGFIKTPTAGDIYVIYGGDTWKSYASGTTGIGAVKDVAVANNVAYFAHGSGDNIRRMTYVSGSHAFAYADDGTNKADHLHVFHDPVNGPVIWRGEDDAVDVSRADAVAWGSNLSFGTEIEVGDDSSDIVNMIDYDRKLWVFKEDGVYVVLSDRAEKLNVGLDFIKSPNNGEAVIVHKLYLMFSWGNFTIQRYYGSDLSSIGYDKGHGMPDSKRGKCVAMASHPAGLFAVNDSENGTSSVLVRDEVAQGWHEIFTAPSGMRVRDVYLQDNPGTHPILWFSCGGTLFYQKWPRDTFNPLEDSACKFQHEGVIEFADIDMGATRLPKVFQEFNVISENLTDGISIYLDYKIDDDDDWVRAGNYSISPHDTLLIREDNSRRIKLRLRFYTDTASTPPIFVGSTLEGIMRTPFRRQWTFRCRASGFQVTRIGVIDTDPSILLRFLYEMASEARICGMRTRFHMMDDIPVIVEPPSVTRTSSTSEIGKWSAIFEFTVREVGYGENQVWGQ